MSRITVLGGCGVVGTVAVKTLVSVDDFSEIIPFSDEDARTAFIQFRIGTMNLRSDPGDTNIVFIKITPEPKVVCYGLGSGFMEISSSHTNAGYYVTIPENRR